MNDPKEPIPHGPADALKLRGYTVHRSDGKYDLHITDGIRTMVREGYDRRASAEGYFFNWTRRYKDLWAHSQAIHKGPKKETNGTGELAESIKAVTDKLERLLKGLGE